MPRLVALSMAAAPVAFVGFAFGVFDVAGRATNVIATRLRSRTDTLDHSDQRAVTGTESVPHTVRRSV